MSQSMLLEENQFKTVVEHAPLIAIDLIVWRPDGEVLLGKRKNRPARGYWFVPGGRVRKDESLDDAFRRIARTELGLDLVRADHALHGVFEHFYSDNFSGDDFSTHYVVLAYRVELDRLESPPEDQHSDYVWMGQEALLADRLVHRNTKAYFRSEKPQAGSTR